MKDFNTLVGSINDLSGDQIYDFLNYLIYDEDFDINNDKILRLKGMIKSGSIVSISSVPSSEFSCTYDIVVYADDGAVLSFNVLDNDLIERALKHTFNVMRTLDDVKSVFDNLSGISEGLTQFMLGLKGSNHNEYFDLARNYYGIVNFFNIIPIKDNEDAKRVLNAIRTLYNVLNSYAKSIHPDNDKIRELNELISKYRIPKDLELTINTSEVIGSQKLTEKQFNEIMDLVTSKK